MKRRYKLLLIIIAGIILTIVIENLGTTQKLTLVALGDGVSIGMTPYEVAGISFNDYLKDSLEKEESLDKFNNEFAQENLTIHTLNEYLKDNALGKYTKTPIKQTIASADILTIAIGVDELATTSLSKKITEETISSYLQEVNSLFSTIREFNQNKIIFISLYPAYNLNKKDTIEINSQLKTLCGKYNIMFLDILAISLEEDNYLEPTSYYFSYKAHKKIANILYNMV